MKWSKVRKVPRQIKLTKLEINKPINYFYFTLK